LSVNYRSSEVLAVLILSSIEESSTVAIRPPKHNSQGYTLLEMLTVVGIMSIIVGFSVPSLLAFNKPLRDGTSQFKSHLSLIRSKAISSNQAYRIRPKFPQTSQYTGQKYQNTPHNFIVEYAANCQVTTYGTGLPSDSADPRYNATYPTGTPDGWQQASQFDLDLPETVGVSDTPVTEQSPDANSNPVTISPTSTTLTIRPASDPVNPTSVTIEPYLNWNICYDNRGIVHRPVNLTIKDFQANNQAVTSSIRIQKVGGLIITTNDKDSNPITADSQGNPIF
jgi:prepilin-type N-terminal cleavage/methylation domain-containing protein